MLAQMMTSSMLHHGMMSSIKVVKVNMTFRYFVNIFVNRWLAPFCLLSFSSSINTDILVVFSGGHFLDENRSEERKTLSFLVTEKNNNTIIQTLCSIAVLYIRSFLR